MTPLTIHPTKSTPGIFFDPDHRTWRMTGESYPENAAAFYEPVLAHLRQWLNTAMAGPFTVEFALRYYNSSTSKAIMNLLDMLQTAAHNGWNIRVVWHFHEENDIIRESGEEFAEDYDGLKFHICALPME